MASRVDVWPGQSRRTPCSEGPCAQPEALLQPSRRAAQYLTRNSAFSFALVQQMMPLKQAWLPQARRAEGGSGMGCVPA